MARKRLNVQGKETSKRISTNGSIKELQQKTGSNQKQTFNPKNYALFLFVIAACVVAIYPDVITHLIPRNGNGASSSSDSVTNPSTDEGPSVSSPSSVDPVATNRAQDIPDEVKNFKPHWQKSFSVKKIFADGRRIPPVELLPQKETNSSVKLYVFDNFLSDMECDGLMKAHDRHVQEMNGNPLLCFDSQDTLRQHISEVGIDMAVTPDMFSPGTTCLNASLSTQIQTVLNSNWSYSTAFYPQESKFSTIVSNRMKDAMGLEPESGGKFQITSYPVGKAYKIHTDCILGSHELRDRSVSVIMYLNDVKDGGETKFPDLGISVQPKKGRALVWNNMSPEGQCEPNSRHVASVVKSGSKYILMRWYYYKSFYTIGKRMTGPALPPRGDDVPMVMCDVYTHGSCRWYDEWTPQVLTQYVQNQHKYV